MATIAIDGGAGAASLSGALAAMAERVSNGVVQVRSRGQGAGTVWRAGGIIVTNHHVAPDDVAEVILQDGRRFGARVVARDAGNDIAVLRVDARDLPALLVRDSRTLRAGELVIAVGHPVGMVGAASAGIVTEALPGGAAGGEREMIRANVLLRPGNSGGPLVDARGQVVGINAMVGGGFGLSVPSHVVTRLLGAGERPLLGVGVQAVTLSAAVAARAGGPQGLLVISLSEGGAAERTGVLIGDVLVAFGGQALASPNDLLAELAAHAGGPARLLLLRGGVPQELLVPLPGRVGDLAA